MQEVVIIQKSLPQYRIAFFNKLRAQLQKHNIILKLIYGDTVFDKRKDLGKTDWAIFKQNKIFGFGKYNFIWQPCLIELKGTDLIIIEPASKLLINYLLILKKKIRNQKLAFWGHAIDIQTSPGHIFNKLKLILINQPSWWFAYTKKEKKFIVSNGVNDDHVTVVQNSIDTKLLNFEYCSISENEKEELKKLYNIKDERILIYCGALTKEKNIEFLIATANQLGDKGVNFKLFIIGSGDYEDYVKDSTKTNSHIIFVGTKFGRDKAKYFSIAELFLLPGAVGLAILDSFALETPLVTIDIPNHGPEIEYLENRINGIITKPNLQDYVIEIYYLLSDYTLLNKLKSACKPMIEKYNIEIMVNNFTAGILKALQEK